MGDKIKFGVFAALISLAFWLVFVYGYGEFFLMDDVVPEKGYEISDWMYSFYLAGAISAIVGFICSCIWYFFGVRYAGEDGITVKFYALLIIATILGFIVAFAFILPAVDGSGLSLLFAWLISPAIYYVNSLVNYAPAVKYIPPFGENIHK